MKVGGYLPYRQIDFAFPIDREWCAYTFAPFLWCSFFCFFVSSFFFLFFLSLFLSFFLSRQSYVDFNANWEVLSGCCHSYSTSIHTSYLCGFSPSVIYAYMWEGVRFAELSVECMCPYDRRSSDPSQNNVSAYFKYVPRHDIYAPFS